METLKLTTWNIKHLDRLIQDDLTESQIIRKSHIAEEIHNISPDILCLLEGPKGEGDIDKVAKNVLGDEYIAVKAVDGEYMQKGLQWIWFLVHRRWEKFASLLPPATWIAFTEGKSWDVNYWGNFESTPHQHYRHPQVLILELNGHRLEFIGLHLKSKFVNNGASDWKAGGERRNTFIASALKARIKMATEAINVRKYINAKFNQAVNPALFVLGDLNDGPGKEYFESDFLFFDLLSNIQGDVFSADKFLNHALFDFPGKLRWSVEFKDFITPERDPHILLDHILFTQALVDGSIPFSVAPHAGKVEHEVHELINAPLKANQKTSDHRPVSVDIYYE